MTVGTSKMKIQGAATCRYLCMDRCGLLYGSREFGEECVFNEMLEPDNYNTYSSAKYSNDQRTLFLALNRRGQSRKVLHRTLQPLGRLSSYVRVLIRTVSPESPQESHLLRHHAHYCLSSNATTAQPSEGDTDPVVDQFRCRRKKRRKKIKKKCPSETCDNKEPQKAEKKVQFKVRKKCADEGGVECRRPDGAAVKKRQQLKLGAKRTFEGGRKRKKYPKRFKFKKFQVSATTEVVTMTEVLLDQDYVAESTTHWDWDDATVTTEEYSTSYTD